MAADGQGDGSDAVLLDRDHLASDRELDIFATAYDAVFACGEGLELSRGGKDQRAAAVASELAGGFKAGELAGGDGLELGNVGHGI